MVLRNSSHQHPTASSKRDDESPVDAEIREQRGDAGGLQHLRGLGHDDERARVFERAGEQVAGPEQRHVVQHDGGDDLVGAGLRLEHTRRCPPRPPAERTGPERQEQVQGPRDAVDAEADPGARQRADAQLALSADVEQAAPKRQPDGQAGQDVRRGPDQRLGDGVRPPERAFPEPAVRQDRVAAGEPDQHRTSRQPGQHGERLDQQRLTERRTLHGYAGPL